MEKFYFRFFIGLILTCVFALIDPFREYDFGHDVILIAIDHASGDIYVSGNSCIYHLDRNFSRLEQTCLGVGAGASIANQDTNVLEIDNTFHCLLVCTSAGGGQCELLSLRNITERLRILSNDSKGSKVEVSENYRPIVHFLSKNNTSHVVVASPNDFTIQSFERPSEMSKPILSVRAISVIRDEFHMTYKTSLGPHSEVLQISKRKNSFYYDFINGFCYNDTCFYLTLQQENITSKTLVNRIACINSSSLFPYIDIPVGEYRDNRQQTYNRVVAMTLGKVGIGSETPVVVFVYGVAAGVTSKDIDVARGYAIRVTPLEKITEGIDTVIGLCRNQVPFVKLPDWYYNISGDCTQVQWNVLQPKVMQSMRWDTIWSASLVIPGNASEMSNVTSVFTHTQPFLNGDPQIKLPGEMAIYVTMSSGRIYYFYCSWETITQVTVQFVKFTLLDGGGTHIKRPVVKSDSVTSEEDYYILYGSKVFRRPLDYCQDGGTSTCSECTKIPGCVWCLKTNQCLLKAKCQEDEGCPLTIDSFEPRSGPLNGGTRITLQGSALSREDISVKICGENCSSPVYFQSEVMSCTVPSSTNNWTECAINVSSKNRVLWTSLMDNEKSFFTYRIPKVWKMEPNRMLKSEQSSITFRGEHLNTGSHVSIFFDSGISCQVRYRKQDSMECQLKLSPKLESEHFVKENKYKVNITVDNYALLTSDLGTLLLYPEPIITGIYPNWTFYGGGVPITVYGSNLHFMQSPLIQISLPSDTQRLIQQGNCQPCLDVINSICLRCCTSNVTTYTSPTDHQTAFVSFSFISVSNRSVIYNMSKDHQLLSLVPDPTFTLGDRPISGCTLYDDQSPLILTGQNIFSPTILKVFVNETPCPVLNAMLNSLTCDLQRTFQDKTSNNLRTTNLQVDIKVRRH